MHLTRKRDASKEQSAGSTTLAVSNSYPSSSWDSRLTPDHGLSQYVTWMNLEAEKQVFLFSLLPSLSKGQHGAAIFALSE